MLEKSKNIRPNSKNVPKCDSDLKRCLFQDDRRGNSIIPQQVQKLFNKTFALVDFFSQSGKNPKIWPKNPKMFQNVILISKGGYFKRIEEEIA